MSTAGCQFLLLTLVFTPADATGDFMDSPGISFIEINVSQTEKTRFRQIRELMCAPKWPKNS